MERIDSQPKKSPLSTDSSEQLSEVPAVPRRIRIQSEPKARPPAPDVVPFRLRKAVKRESSLAPVLGPEHSFGGCDSLRHVVPPSRPSSGRSRSRFLSTSLEHSGQSSSREQRTQSNLNSMLGDQNQPKSVIPRLDLSGVSAPTQCSRQALPGLKTVLPKTKSLPVDDIFERTHQEVSEVSSNQIQLQPLKMGFFSKKKIAPLEKPIQVFSYLKVDTSSTATTQASLKAVDVNANLAKSLTVTDHGLQVPHLSSPNKMFFLRKKSVQSPSEHLNKETEFRKRGIFGINQTRLSAGVQNVLPTRSDPGVERTSVAIEPRGPFGPRRSISIKRRSRQDSGFFVAHNSSTLDEDMNE